MRSESQERLMQIDSIFRAAMQQALEEQNQVHRRGPGLEVNVQLVGDRPSGETARDATLLLRAQAVIRHFGDEPALSRSSTDSNIPIARGIPAITIGGGGQGGNAHSPDEWYRNEGAVEGL